MGIGNGAGTPRILRARMNEELWTLRQLERLEARAPGSTVEALRELLANHPALREAVVVGAAEEDQISLAEGAERLGLPLDDLTRRVVDHRRNNGTSVDPDGGPNGPRLRGSHVAVWEIVREYRLHGSLDAIARDFPAIPHKELEAALEYAETHSEEIDSFIDRYESLFAHRTSLG